MAGRLRRLAPPAALFLGLFAFGVTLLVLGTEATDEGTRELDPSQLTARNGTALLVYPVDYFGQRTERIDVTYAFPQSPGDAFFVGCEDVDRLMRGAAPVEPMLVFASLREGTFAVSHQTVSGTAQFYVLVQEANEERPYRRYCDPALVFRWAAVESDLGLNRPNVTALYHSANLDGGAFAVLALFMTGSAILTLTGGLAWARGRAGDARPLSEDSTVEALRSSLDRMGEQLERTRKHLILAGVLGVFLWYPFLVPWAWQQAARSSDDPLVPWGVAALTLAFLIVLTVLWAREFWRLDRELRAWRARMQELRDREDGLMDTLDLQGG